MSSNKMRDEEKAIAAAVLSAIIVLAGLLAYILLTPVPQEAFVSLFLLDSEKEAENYNPQLLVLGENNTFLLWFGVENFMGRIEYCSVSVKIDNGTLKADQSPLEPVCHFEKVLLNKETWEFPVTTTVNQVGKHRIIFELWLFDEFENVFRYSGIWCSIWFDVIES